MREQDEDDPHLDIIGHLEHELALGWPELDAIPDLRGERAAVSESVIWFAAWEGSIWTNRSWRLGIERRGCLSRAGWGMRYERRLERKVGPGARLTDSNSVQSLR